VYGYLSESVTTPKKKRPSNLQFFSPKRERSCSAARANRFNDADAHGLRQYGRCAKSDSQIPGELIIGHAAKLSNCFDAEKRETKSECRFGGKAAEELKNF